MYKCKSHYTHRQFTIPCSRLNFSNIKISSSLGYLNSYFYKNVICCSNGYISFFYYIHGMLLLFVNANVIHHVWERWAFVGENAKEAHGEVYKFHTFVISLIKFRYFSFLRTALLLRLDSKQTDNSRTYIHLDWIRKRRSGRLFSPVIIIIGFDWKVNINCGLK